MLILAMESSGNPASVALCSDGMLLAQYFQNSELTHSKTLLVMAHSMLDNLNVSISDLDLIAVANGPGSFTGVRIGVSAAKGLAWGGDIPICGISTLEAMAYQIGESSYVICSVMDARRSQVYNALFQHSGNDVNRLCIDRAISLDDLASELKSINAQYLLVGDGAQLVFEHMSNIGITCKIAPELLKYQTAYGVARAAEKAKITPVTDLEPMYLRPSQAERENTINN
ncbi:MAG: tRNA (adenosine(37)-N6)-threonylcarbamoyltransferase complex dimerization subunit type 1 TsaB [Oscillospiraceae bacterium]|nr:tRNA (adenosine(37)-N6)-threonylcarbamoyltransferase complex dimerization subunit type 1 TsaB [Oscillospiraceae bacterium]